MTLKEIASTPAKPKFSISLRWLMALGFGSVVALSVGLVLFMSASVNLSNTYSLLHSRALSLIDNMERSIRSQTNQAERTVEAMGKLFDEGSLKIGDLDNEQNAHQTGVLKSLMITAPVVEALLMYDLDGNRSGIFKTPEGIIVDIPFAPGVQNELVAGDNITAASKNMRPAWGEPVFLNNILFHNVGFPLISGGEVAGIAVAAIGQNNMNKIITELGRENDTTAFVLTHDNKIIAHSHKPGFFEGKSAIELSKFPDRGLNQFEAASNVEEFEDLSGSQMKVYESGRGIRDNGFVFVLTELKGYAAKPYRLGAYFAKSEITTEIRRIIGSIMVGLAALLLAILISFLLSRRLSNPMKRIAKVANKFSNLELENFTPLPSSRIHEIDEQAKAMNSMHTALREFSRYVPQTLVKKLMASGTEATRSVEREVTIMFADIVGFTTMSEELNAVETAKLLNAHFDMLCGEISKNNGTLDKFIGDGLLAFWGAPDADNDQAINALNAAQGILKDLTAYNIQRKTDGFQPMGLRIGIHTGRVVVGNIGSCDRHNYTIVGDAVNVANRLEILGNEFLADDEAVVLASAETWNKSGSPNYMHSTGMHKLRGREAMIEVYKMDNSKKNFEVLHDMKNTG